jgi:Protein of unknown function (DUF3431)
MLQTRRGPVLLGIAAFFLTLVFLRFTQSPSWHTMPQVVGLGDLVPDGKDTEASEPYENLRFKSSRHGAAGINLADPFYTPFVPGTAKPAGSNYTRHLVMAKTKKEDVDWIYDEALDSIEKKVYGVDDRHAALKVPKNKGHEVMVYLTYIIDHYDELPDVSIFMHAHQFAWHQNELLNNDGVEMVKRLSSERVSREGYMNLRCHWMPGCPDWMHPGTVDVDINKQEETIMAQAWAELFPDRAIPEVLAQPCCAQFALSRDRIMVRSKERYEFFREWLLRTPLDDKISGRVWEYLWQVVFTDQPVFCPNQWACYCDGYGVCFENEQDFDDWFQLRWKRLNLELDLKEWRKKAEKVEEYRQRGRLVGIEGSEIDIPEIGKNAELTAEMARLEVMMEDERMKAIERGADPRFRAYTAGREWNEGDGY